MQGRKPLGFIILAAASLLGTSSLLHAGQPVGAPFLSINPSPRMAALGGAGAALEADASTLFVNPGGLGSGLGTQLHAAHASVFNDSTLDAVNFVHPAGAGHRAALALSAVYLRSPAINSLDENGNSSGSFTPSDLSAGVSFGQQVRGAMALGGTVKFIQQRIQSDSASGYAFDIGAQAPTGLRYLSMGLAFKNIGPSMKFVDEKFALPSTGQFGLGYRNGVVGLMADLVAPLNGGSTRVAFGMEYMPAGSLVLRSGYLVDGARPGPDAGSDAGRLARFAGLTAGIGLKLGRYDIDYALVPHDALGNSQQVSFLARFQ